MRTEFVKYEGMQIRTKQELLNAQSLDFHHDCLRDSYLLPACPAAYLPAKFSTYLRTKRRTDGPNEQTTDLPNIYLPNRPSCLDKFHIICHISIIAKIWLLATKSNRRFPKIWSLLI